MSPGPSPPHPAPAGAAHVNALRDFDRFFMQRLGVLAAGPASGLSQPEMRVLDALAHRDNVTATQLARELALDAGYLSRILRRFHEAGWLQRTPSPTDARQILLGLTVTGHAFFAPLQQRSRDAGAGLLTPLNAAERVRVIDAMDTIRRLLDPRRAATAPAVLLRDPLPGDMGWVVMQHGQVYGHEHGFNWEFEALVADIAAGFIRNFKPARDKGWIVEIDGERAGSAFVVQKTATVAQLRLLLLAANARGHGIGGKLVDECVAFARSKHYRKLILWTNGHLHAARAIYKSRGFQLSASETFQGYGRKDLVGETWELRL
ncbi:MAG: helix-turn-helix domain-containing GNAT family N-acetyltransferase [Ramlibacter sp.]